MIEYHADDFGLFLAQSRRILDCCKHGVVNGISVMPNSPYLDECMKQIEPLREHLEISIHLNLMEGKSCCLPDQIPLLVNEKGIFKVSFLKLLSVSFLPVRKKYQEQISKEIRAQIQAVLPYLNGKPLRIDSHSHYHMIPVVFDALMEVIKRESLKVSYIRIPKESVSIYRAHRKNGAHIHSINIIEVLVLNILGDYQCWRHKAVLQTMEKKLFSGVMCSGKMCLQTLQMIVPRISQLAQESGCGVEVLAHPGGVYETEDIAQLTSKNDIDFLTSPLRNEEAEAFLRIKEINPNR